MSRWDQYWVDRGFGLCLFGYILFILIGMSSCNQLSYGKDLKMNTMQIKTQKISHHLGRNRAISFPLGPPPKGTCEFATENCIRECSGFHVNFKPEHDTYSKFCKFSICYLVRTIQEECKGKLLSWFTESGDCPAAMTDKIWKVMLQLSAIGVKQNGFTRNSNLWIRSHKIKDVRLVLTEERKEYIEKYRAIGLVAVPIYQECRVKIYNHNTIWLCGGGGVVCGSGYVEGEDGETTEEDCGICMKLNRGCFAA